MLGKKKRFVYRVYTEEFHEPVVCTLRSQREASAPMSFICSVQSRERRLRLPEGIQLGQRTFNVQSTVPVKTLGEKYPCIYTWYDFKNTDKHTFKSPHICLYSTVTDISNIRMHPPLGCKCILVTKLPTALLVEFDFPELQLPF